MSLAWIALLAQTVATTAPVPARPFAVGESFTYKGKKTGLIPISAGTTTLSVVGIENVRGVPSWKFEMYTEISTVFFKGKSRQTSWTGVNDFISRRFLKWTTDTSVNRPETEDFNIYPDSGFFRRGRDTGTKATPKEPLDDLAFVYFIRTVPLAVGGNYSFPRYYRDNIRNLTLTVTGRDTLELPDKTKVVCLVMHPVVEQANGMFRKDAKATLWMSDDERRIPVRIESTYSFGRIQLNLDRMTLALPTGSK